MPTCKDCLHLEVCAYFKADLPYCVVAVANCLTELIDIVELVVADLFTTEIAALLLATLIVFQKLFDFKLDAALE